VPQPRQRASRPHVVALLATVALAASLPLAAATAGPGAEQGAAAPEGQARGAAADVPPSGAERADSGSVTERGLLGRSGARDPREQATPHTSCGPELASPEGVEAQTCVLTEGAVTWARTYHRNLTGHTLHAVLSLLGPEGRTVRVRCVLPAGNGSGMCETPRRPAAPQAQVRKKAEDTEFRGERRSAHTAVAEIAPPSGDRLLLRSGSNSPQGQGY
jgi:hypothetical protein